MSNLPQVSEEDEKQRFPIYTKQRSDLQSHAYLVDENESTFDDNESVFHEILTDMINDQQQQSITPGGEAGTIYEMLQENKQAVMNLNYLPNNEEKSNNMNQIRRNMSTFLVNFIVNVGKFKIRRISTRTITQFTDWLHRFKSGVLHHQEYINQICSGFSKMSQEKFQSKQCEKLAKLGQIALGTIEAAFVKDKTTTTIGGDDDEIIDDEYMVKSISNRSFVQAFAAQSIFFEALKEFDNSPLSEIFVYAVFHIIYGLLFQPTADPQLLVEIFTKSMDFYQHFQTDTDHTYSFESSNSVWNKFLDKNFEPKLKNHLLNNRTKYGHISSKGLS